MKEKKPSLWKELAGDFALYSTGVDIYTDGSWDKKTGTIKDVFQIWRWVRDNRFGWNCHYAVRDRLERVWNQNHHDQ